MDGNIKRTFALMNEESNSTGLERVPEATGPSTGTHRQQKTVFRMHLHGDSPPALIFVARKSNPSPPKDWLSEDEDLEAGLEMFGKTVLKDYQKTFDDHRGAVLIAGLGVRTADIFPAESVLPQNDWDRTRLRYADKFSAAIEKELQNSDFDSKIVSIGVDAWGCDDNRIRGFLKRNIIHSFTFVFRTPQFDYGGGILNQKFTQSGQSESTQTWWGEASSAESLERLTRAKLSDNSANQIVRLWNLTQGNKGTESLLVLWAGRNKQVQADDRLLALNLRQSSSSDSKCTFPSRRPRSP